MSKNGNAAERWRGGTVLAATLGLMVGGLGGAGQVFGGESLLRDATLEYWAEHPEKKIKLDEWDEVRLLDRQDTAAASQHPATLSSARLAAMLVQVQVVRSERSSRLFTDEEVERLAPALAAGLSIAGARQDVGFLSTARRELSESFGARMSNVGRVFVENGRVNLLIGMAVSDVLHNQRPGTKFYVSLHYGERARASAGVSLRAGEGARSRRADWIDFPMDASATSIAPAAAGAVSAPQSQSTVTSAVSDEKTRAFYREQTVRLQELQRLRDTGLITAAEFEQKRAEILKGL